MIALGVFVFAAIVAVSPLASSDGGPCESIQYVGWKYFEPTKTCIMTSTAINSPDFLITSVIDGSIQWLYASKNWRLQNLPKNTGDKFPNLLRLDASECSIKRISKENFKGLNKVRSLYLAFNLIETIDDDTFEYLHAVEKIHLGSNKIKQLNGHAFNLLSKLLQLRLNDNECIDEDFVAFRITRMARIITEKCGFSSIPQTPPKESKGCGVPLKAAHTTTSGVNPTRGDFPWLVALQRKLLDKTQPEFFCSGFLISEFHVLTAAHCVQDLSPSDITAEFGAYDLDNLSEVGRFSRTPSNIFPHDQWDPQYIRVDADIAMLRMNEKIPFSTFVQPICLWVIPETTSPDDPLNGEPENFNGTIAGWDKTLNSTRLHENLPTIKDVHSFTNEDCFLSQPELARISSNRTFCTPTVAGRPGPCSGDSGGGFFLPVENVFYLKGIVTTAKDLNPKGKCITRMHTIYTNVLKHKVWIDNTMARN